MTKKQAQRIHARTRFKQRCNIEFTRKMRFYFINCIQNWKAEFLEKQSLRVSLFRVMYEGKSFKVVYDKKRKEIVTVLPEEGSIK